MAEKIQKSNEPSLSDEIKESVFVKSGDGSYRGWKVGLLVEKIAKVEEKLLLCKVCQGLLREASLFNNEGKQELRCSFCLPENVVAQEGQIIQESINEKSVECPYKDKGCKWSDVITQVIAHLNECDLFPLKCPLGCVAEGGKGNILRVERRYLEEHQRMKCPMRLISCESCNSPIRACEMNEHIQTCEEYLVPCPNSCAEEEGIRKLKRLDVPTHLSEECPLQKVECPYAEYGCKEKMERRLMDQHEKESIHSHFRMSVLRMENVNREQAVKIDKMERSIAEKDKEMKELKDDLNSLKSVVIDQYRGSLEWEVTGVKDQIKNKEISYSDPFYVGLYKCQGCIQWDCGSKGYVGLFIHIMKGSWDDTLKWPLRYKREFILINQTDYTQNYVYTAEISKTELLQTFPECFQKPTEFRSKGIGTREFISHEKIQEEKYLKDDSISLRIIVERLPT